MLHFILNDENISTKLHPATTVLDFIRYKKHLKGTKIGCREGDCGACTVIVGSLEKKSSEVAYKTMTSCLLPLGNVQGKHLVTVEGLNMENLSPVQEALVKHNGTQCGFCTVGFVNSLSCFLLEKGRTFEDAIKCIDGNICRCTGYKSIEKAALEISEIIADKPESHPINWLLENGFLPNYFKNIAPRLSELSTKNKDSSDSSEQWIGGGTDLYVQKHDEMIASFPRFLFEEESLKGITSVQDTIKIGAMTTVSEFLESRIIQNNLPDISKYMKLVSSTPIRNMASIGGNFINASPIGDMTILFLALNAKVVFKKGERIRSFLLKDLYWGYKNLAIESGEMLVEIQFKPVREKAQFNFEKVSKRTHLDIASVNSACMLLVDKNNLVTDFHLSAGGVAPIPKYLEGASQFLIGKEINDENIKELLNIVQDEISPISDARGSETYKRLLLRQLILCHYNKFFPSQISVQNILQHA